MIVYNITFAVDDQVGEEWIKWTKAVFLPAYEATGFFDDSRLLEVLGSKHDGHTSYSAQLFTTDKQRLVDFHHEHGEQLQRFLKGKFGDRCVTFDTVLEVL